MSADFGGYDKSPDIIDLIRKDICFLYHQLSEYSSIMGDLDFNNKFSLPYWDYIDLARIEVREDEVQFIREGCFVMILAMAWESIDGSGCYIVDKLDLISDRLKTFLPEDDKQVSLHEIVSETVKCINHPNSVRYDDLMTKSNWVYDEFVRGYFKRRSF